MRARAIAAEMSAVPTPCRLHCSCSHRSARHGCVVLAIRTGSRFPASVTDVLSVSARVRSPDGGQHHGGQGSM